MNDPWTLRPATAQDHLLIAHHRFPDLPLGTQDHQGYAEWVGSAIERDLYLGWMAEAQGQVIGSAGLVVTEWGSTRGNFHPWQGRIVNVYTLDAWRSCGVAHRLVEKLILEAEDRGIHTLGLSAAESSKFT